MISILEELAKLSKVKRLQVSCVLLKDNRIVATGINGYLNGKKEQPLIDSYGHDIASVHAEANMIAFCAKNGIATKDCVVIISHYPCNNCTKQLYQSGIKKIYYINDYKNNENIFKKYIKIKKYKYI